MLQAMRFRHFERDGGVLPTSSRFAARRILEVATIHGARSLGMEQEIGSLSVGKKADVILTRTDSITTSPVTDPVAALVFYADVADVDSVWINGVARKRHGRLTNIDWPSTERKLRQSRDNIIARYRRIPMQPLRDAWAPLWGLSPSTIVS